MSSIFETMSRAESWGITLTRIGIIVVLLWIGGLKVTQYEAEGIVPFVANSPVMSFLMDQPQDYKAHMNPEGKLVPENKAWHAEHGTYFASYLIGAIIVSLGILLFVTLSFLITTPESWVPALGDADHGFPYLSGRGRLVIKDAIMMGGALVVMADSAKAYLRKRGKKQD